jgi:hypothetical protein
MANPVSVPRRSRLRFTEYLSLDGFEFWDFVDLPTIPEQPDDSLYQVRSIDRLDTIAFRFYGDPIFWWVIAAANGLELVETELNVGDILRIPSPRYVKENLFVKAKV